MYRQLAIDIDLVPLLPKICGAAGLARKAGKLTVGGAQSEEAIRAGKAVLVLLSSDLSDNAAKKLHNAMKTHGVPYLKLPLGKEELAAACGKGSYATACALCDSGFAEILYRLPGVSDGAVKHESK